MHKITRNLFALASILFLLTGVARGAGGPAPSVRAAAGPGAAQSQQDARELMREATVERELAGGEAHAYRITLNPGQFLRVKVDQRGIDVITLVYGPDDQLVAGMDTMNDQHGPEEVSVLAKASGVYRLEVRALFKGVAPGHYTLTVKELREATPQDEIRTAAERGLAEGSHLAGQAAVESAQKAIKKFEEALPLWRIVGDSQGEAYTLRGLSTVYYGLGEYQKALEYHRQSMPLLRALGIRDVEAYTLIAIGNVHWWLGDNQLALEYSRQALQLSRAIGSRSNEAGALELAGIVYWVSGEYQEALKNYEQALTWRTAGYRHYTLNGLGLTYWKLGQHQRGQESLNEALTLARAVGDHFSEGPTLTLLGVVYDASGERQKAYDTLSEALALHRAQGNRQFEAVTLYWIGRNESERGLLDQARARIESALEITESQRTKVVNQQLRTSYLATTRDFYDLYIDLLMRLHGREPAQGFDALALRASERARARSLLETLIEANADIRRGADPTLLERERALQQQLNAKEQSRMQLLGRKATEEQLKAVEKELSSLIGEYQETWARIRTTSPRYAALAQPVPVSLQEIQQQLLDDGTLLLEYALGENRSYLWAVTQTSIDSFELPQRAEIETAARRAYELLTTSHRRQGRRAAELAAAELSQMVLGPVAGRLGRKRLLIVSEGALQYIPFGALPAPKAGVGEKSSRSSIPDLQPPIPDPHPLILDHEIVNLPSVSVLAVLRREFAGRQPASRAVAVLADPVLQSDDPRVKRGGIKTERSEATAASLSQKPPPESDLTRSARESGVTTFVRLRFTRQEADAIVAQAGERNSLKALDFNASRATVTGADLDQYRIVHFATHGLLNSQHPELSGVVLSLVDEQGRPVDGFLRAHEIYNLKLKADLVVLSACQTALGKEIKGEGLVGLTRGFMYAGAARVLASLWDVRDEATSELMRRFYRAMLREGLKPAAALRAAQVSMSKERRWEAPYYWAGFVLQGEWK